MRVLFYQHEELNHPNYLAIDGEALSVDDAEQYSQRILSVAEKVISKGEPWTGSVAKCFFVKGFLNEKDELGRRMTFMYLVPRNEAKRDEIKGLLQEDLRNSGKSLAPDTIDSLDRFIRNPFPTRRLEIALIAVALLIWLLYSSLSKCASNDRKYESAVNVDSGIVEENLNDSDSHLTYQ